MDNKEQEMLEYLISKDDEIKALEEENEKLLDETLLLEQGIRHAQENFDGMHRLAMDLMSDNLDIKFKARNIRNRQYLYWFIIGFLSVAVAYLFFK